MKKLVLLVFGIMVFLSGRAAAETIDFENLTLAPESAWNGSDGEGDFVSGFAEFSNYFQSEPWEAWSGFAYSNRTDSQVRGYGKDGGEFNAITGGGHDGSEIYAVAYFGGDTAEKNPTIRILDGERVISGAYFTNTNVAYYSMLEGDDFASPFDEDDWLKVKVTGFDEDGAETGDLEFYLAIDGDIVDSWKWVDFSVLGSVGRIEFAMESTDEGEFGMNTPAYFAMDSVNGNAPDDTDSSSDTCFINTLSSGFFR